MEILSPLQKELLSIFPGVPESDFFYLTGGTALSAFYLKHRKSNDLDFFTDNEDIISSFSFRIEAILKDNAFTLERSRGLHSFVELIVNKRSCSTLIHLAQDAPFRFEPTKTFPDFPRVRIDSLKDIASNKLLALFQRATLRDFIDIYFLVTGKHFSAEELTRLAKEKDPGFDLYWLGVAFERINLFSKNEADMLLLIKDCSLGDLISFFNAWREDIAKTLR